jgi:hypothetical protein
MNTRTALTGVALVVVAVALLIVLSGGEDNGDETTSSNNAVGGAAKSGGGKGKPAERAAKPEEPTIVVGGDGEPVGGVTEITVNKGDEVRFEVKSAVADEIHVHGYDLMKDVEAGGAVSFAFPAEIEGIFEAELEERAEQILELRVEP